jgi:hypothetical protein
MINNNNNMATTGLSNMNSQMILDNFKSMMLRMEIVNGDAFEVILH